MSLTQRIIQNALFSSLSQGWSFLVGLFLTPFLLSKLGTQGFAIWSLTYVLLGALTSLDLGLGITLTKSVATILAEGHDERLSEILSTAVFLSIGLDLILIGAIALCADPYLRFVDIPAARLDEAKFVLLACALILTLANTIALFQSTLYGAQRLDWVAGINFFATCLFAAGAIATLQAGWGLQGLVLTATVSELATASLLIVALHRLLPWARVRPHLFRREQARTLVTYGARIQITNIGSLFSTQFNKVLAGHFVGLVAVAGYELGLRLAFNIALLPLWLLPAALPAASEMQALRDVPRLMELYRRGTRYIWIGATLLAGLLLLAAPQIVAVWTASIQPEAAQVTRWLTFAFWMVLMTAVSTTIARGIGRAGLETRYAILVVIMQLSLAPVLAQWQGLAGLLAANTAAMVVGALFFVVLFHRALAQPLVPFVRQVFLSPVLISLPLLIAGLVALAYIPLSLFTNRIAGLTILSGITGTYSILYFLGLWATGHIRKEEVQDFTKAIRALVPAR